MNITQFVLPIALLLTSPAHAGGIAWRTSLSETQREAGASQSVVFLAVNMDGERANDRMVKEVYSDKAIQSLSTHTLNLIASNDTHSSSGKTCKRFGEITCEDHRHVDADVRSEVLAPDEGGFVVAPQHVFLGPDGGVLLSVPYEIRAEELEWCFAMALRTNDPDLQLKVSSEARPPKRLIMGGVFQVGAEAEATPLTRESALELISELKKGLLRGEELRSAYRRLAMADEPEARDYMLSVLRTVPRAGGRGGRGGGPGGDDRDDNGEIRDRRPRLMRWIGANSPRSYWEVCIEFIDENDAALRAEAVVAIEQLGAKESVKAINSRLRKEKDEAIKKNLLRALGTCGADDKTARKTLLKQAGSKKEPVLQTNAILALGWLSAHEDVTEALNEFFTEEEGAQRIPATLAMAISRDESWIAVLKEALEADPDAELKSHIEAALLVLEGGSLQTVESRHKEVAGDEIPRDRLFGATRVEAPEEENS